MRYLVLKPFVYKSRKYKPGDIILTYCDECIKKHLKAGECKLEEPTKK